MNYKLKLGVGTGVAVFGFSWPILLFSAESMLLGGVLFIVGAGVMVCAVPKEVEV